MRRNKKKVLSWQRAESRVLSTARTTTKNKTGISAGNTFIPAEDRAVPKSTFG